MEYKRLFLTYPHSGSKIHKTRSLTRGIRKCYDEFKEMNDIGEGFFVVTDLNDNCEYKFKVKDKKIYRVKQNNQNNQTGGNPEQEQQPVSVVEQQPVPVVEQQPVPIVEQQHISSPVGGARVGSVEGSVYKIGSPTGKKTWGATLDLHKTKKEKAITPRSSPTPIRTIKINRDKQDHLKIMKELNLLKEDIKKIDKKLDKMKENKEKPTDNNWCIFM